MNSEIKSKKYYLLILVGALIAFLLSTYWRMHLIRPMQIVCLGDSITSGFRLPDPKKSSFPSQLEGMSGNRWNIINAGVPGATAIKKGDIPIWTQGAFVEVMETAPEVVIFMLGTNDTKDNNWQYRDTFVSDYTEIVQRLKRLPSDPKIFVLSIPPVIGEITSGISEERASELTRDVKGIAEDNGVYYLDITTPLTGKPQLFLDGLHPNEQGDGIIAKLLMNAIINS